MFKRRWRDLVALGLALALAFSWLVVALKPFDQSVEHRGAAYERDNAESEAPEKSGDLKAQESMALAAWFQVGISMFGVLIAGAGVVYVALTLRHTADQAKTAREHMERLETPFLRAVPVQPDPDDVSFDWTKQTMFRLENCGRSYAVVTHFSAATVHFGKFVKGEKFDRNRDRGRFVGDDALIVPPGGFSMLLKADHPVVIDESHPDMVGQGGAFHGIVRYRDALGNRYVMGFAFTYISHLREYMLLVSPEANYHYREGEAPVPPT